MTWVVHTVEKKGTTQEPVMRKQNRMSWWQCGLMLRHGDMMPVDETIKAIIEEDWRK